MPSFYHNFSIVIMRKKIKIADLGIQVLLFLTGLAVFLFTNEEQLYFYFYYLLGSWQILSLIIHHIDNRGLQFFQKRRIFGQAIVWVIVTGAVSLLLLILKSPVIIFYLFGLLLFSPFLAIWYMSICYREILQLRKRELIHLK